MGILNPHGHPKVDLDFPTTKGRKLPYRCTTFLRHLPGSISVNAAYAWGQPVHAPLGGTAVARNDGAPDRKRTGLAHDLKNRVGTPFPK
jgi:hypothetical protein